MSKIFVVFFIFSTIIFLIVNASVADLEELESARKTYYLALKKRYGSHAGNGNTLEGDAAGTDQISSDMSPGALTHPELVIPPPIHNTVSRSQKLYSSIYNGGR